MDLFDVYGSRSDDDDQNDDTVEDHRSGGDAVVNPSRDDQPVAREGHAGERAADQAEGGGDPASAEARDGDQPNRFVGTIEVSAGNPARHEEAGREFARPRPYQRTGGRTRPDIALGYESLIVAGPHAGDSAGSLSSDHAWLCRLCTTTTSVAEVSAHMRLPIGVTRVIISDAIEAGVVELVSDSVLSDRPSLELMERILHGLQEL